MTSTDVLYNINRALVASYNVQALGLPTAYEMRDFPVPASAPWVALHGLDSGRNVSSMGSNGMDLWRGIFQIDVHVPENSSTAGILGYTDTLLEYYSAGKWLEYNGQRVRIRRSEPSSIRKDEGPSYAKSVSVYWESWSQR